ncbi:mycofactocin dehydrogenase MftG [Microbacterium gorillae]|uniref:mycofactocin dehydrogenase MftG n=1 Tax=Microbacterium gorillae TaxID=1231063 RepID=UPI000B3046D4|nr:mycofactocin system GMC family oxidoreductase MftG [Microbacterium gorillae]
MRRIVVVGGGAAGVPLAVRLAEDPEITVTLVEAGPARDLPPELDDGTSIRAAAPDHPQNWAYPAHLTPERPWLVARGRVLGGSSAINGGAFVRACPAEFDAWAEIGGDAWRYENMLPLMRAIETDLDTGATAVHGCDGPIRVRRARTDTPLVHAFIHGAVELGFPVEPDKNAPGVAGVGTVPSTVVDGVRVSTATAYSGDCGPAGLTIVSETVVHRVLFDGIRTTGVETSDGVIPADDVVLCAGGIGSARVLLASGIGPRAQLEPLGIAVVADLPVGTAFSDHPDVTLTWRAATDLSQEVGSPFPATLDFAADAGDAVDTDLEIVLVTRPLSELLGDEPAAAGTQELPLIVSLQAPRSRGAIRLTSSDPTSPPDIDYGYLAHEDDRARLRIGVRTAAALLTSAAFAAMFQGFTDLDTPTLTDDTQLDAWIRGHLGTAIHLSGSAPMGTVVDGDGRVLGTRGLSVADTSILPTVPTRGPFATAVLIGEHVARVLRAHD